MRECYACSSADTYKRLGKNEIWFPNKGTHFVLCRKCYRNIIDTRYRSNPQHHRERNRVYYLRNRKHCIERNHEWQAKNVEHLKYYRREYREKNRQYIRNYNKEYYKKNRLKIISTRHNKRSTSTTF